MNRSIKHIDKLIFVAKNKFKSQEYLKIEQVIKCMTTEQLKEIVYGDMTDTQIKELFFDFGVIYNV